MRIHFFTFATALFCLALAGCATHDPEARARDTRDGAGLPRQTPSGVLSSFPPADTSFTPLRCKTLGPETECTRS